MRKWVIQSKVDEKVDNVEEQTSKRGEEKRAGEKERREGRVNG